jgi:hypothetical protein
VDGEYFWLRCGLDGPDKRVIAVERKAEQQAAAVTAELKVPPLGTQVAAVISCCDIRGRTASTQ